MAKDITGPLWVFDTVGDMEGMINFSDNPTDVNFNTDIYVQLIRCINATDANTTTFEVVVGAATDPTDTDPLVLAEVAAGTEQDFWIGKRVPGIYLQTLPTNGQIHIIHGYP